MSLKLLPKQDITLISLQIRLDYLNLMVATHLSCSNSQEQICAISKNLKLNKFKYDFDFLILIF